MCGIAGYWGEKKDLRKSQFPSALALQKHRGPDHTGLFESGNVILGHNRLSILDLSEAANQPMTSTCGRYTIVFNGELFNYRLLIQQFNLELTTHSDTEVALQMLQRQGIEALQHFNGFFALAFYDNENHRLLIARDRFGEKPLWYTELPTGEFFFASESKMFDAFDLPKTVAPDQLYHYLRFSYIPAPNSIFSEYKKLLPGHYIVLEKNRAPHFSSWYKEKKVASTTEELHATLLDAVALRLHADVPVGAFLSGGIDSSLIAAMAVKQAPHLKTFTLAFPDEPYYNEADAAELVASHIGTSHHTIAVTTSDVRQQFDSFIKSLDEPFADSSALAVLLLSGEMKKHVTVALGGDAADELFGGYRKHRALLMAQESSWLSNVLIQSAAFVSLPFSTGRSTQWSERTRQLQKLARGLKQTADERYLDWTAWNEERWVSSLLKNKTAQISLPFNSSDDFLKKDQSLVLPNDMLVKIDLMSMQHALEIRSPFLDYRVVAAANGLPMSEKVDSQLGKKALRTISRKYLPESILNGAKKGFEIPLETWLKGPWRNQWLDSLALLQKDPLFEKTALIHLDQAFMKGKGELSSLLFALHVYARWTQK